MDKVLLIGHSLCDLLPGGPTARFLKTGLTLLSAGGQGAVSVQGSSQLSFALQSGFQQLHIAFLKVRHMGIPRYYMNYFMILHELVRYYTNQFILFRFSCSITN